MALKPRRKSTGELCILAAQILIASEKFPRCHEKSKMPQRREKLADS
ncbi:hypothetical protein [Brucella oryzae]|nr:hypothetical protein [Brucella oryzae]MBR7653260.1 hypothetical protein [Brucella oryzae]